MKKSLDDFVADLHARGFKLDEEAIGFIYFGRKFTGAEDQLIKMAIEVTLKCQKRFDSSFYMSVLEELSGQEWSGKDEMTAHLKAKGMAL
ncbi:hypothetical protein KP77_20900 [Jeotgalibacillus alimentarius]|uniref:Uncharacterized protein n=1 Tax=Jeotgalibacillus alimentarius TaxID=135826 RepID=A0A0C2S4B1_9BACL|nr:DUF6123 family protein [Jeotgalibacillus alimentarius]KIL48879.1 hypothetical protein KP77_20900 [Jeotgalibacillus alimentarius]